MQYFTDTQKGPLLTNTNEVEWPTSTVKNMYMQCHCNTNTRAASSSHSRPSLHTVTANIKLEGHSVERMYLRQRPQAALQKDRAMLRVCQ